MPAAAIGAATTIGGALLSSGSSKKAAKTQSDAANLAAQQQLQMFNTIRGDLTPYRQFGGGALGPLAGLLGYSSFPSSGSMGYGYGTAPASDQLTGSDWEAYGNANPDVKAEWDRIVQTGNAGAFNNDPNQYYQYHWDTFGKNEVGTPGTVRQAPAALGGTTGTGSTAPSTQAYLESIPGYQFAKQQGTNQAINALTARGLGGISGALGKGIARFTTGLADQTYGEQINRLMGAAGLGQNAAVQTGNFGQNAVTSANNANIYGAQSRAAGTLGSAGSIAGGLYGLGNQAGNWNLPSWNPFGGSSSSSSNPFASLEGLY